MQRKILVGGMVAAAALLSAAVPASALEYEVEIRNLSRQVITPPLIITEEQIDEAIDILDRSLEIADREAVETDVAASRSCEYKK